MKNIIKAELLTEEEPYYLLPIVNANLKVVKSNPEVENVNVSATPLEVKVTNQSKYGIEDIEGNIEALELEENQDISDQADFEELKKAAYLEAYTQGLSDVQDKYESLFVKAHSVIDSVKEAIPDYVKKNELIIASIVFEAVSKIIGTVLADKNKALEVVNNIIGGLERNLIEQVYISTWDFDHLKKLEENLLLDNVGAELKSIIDLLKPDANIKLGGCRVALKEGFVDASIDRQLNALINSLVNKANE